MATEEGSADYHPSASIPRGIDAIIDRHYCCLDVGSTPPNYMHKTAYLRLSGKPLTNFNAYDLIQEMRRTINSNWQQSMRLKKQPSMECSDYPNHTSQVETT